MTPTQKAGASKPPAATGDRYQRLVTEMFAKADVHINGDRPFDIKVLDDGFYKRLLKDGQIGLGEAYMDGWWECESLEDMTCRFIGADLHKEALTDPRFAMYFLMITLSGIGKKSKAFEVGEHHYDLGNKLFQRMLDPRMIYSCGYWKDAKNLAEAQEAKLDLICRKIGLRPGMTVLEIGCGWGGWAKFAAEKYGANVVGLTVSKEQRAYAEEDCKGLPVEFKLMDYRDAQGQYDRVVSIAMFEAVGHNYYRTFMKTVDRCLKDDGLFFLHSIVGNEYVPATQAGWLNKYIFPNGELPSLTQIMKSVEGLFVVEGMHRFGRDYEWTLLAWYENFLKHWPELEKEYGGERFFRMWKLYLLLSVGIFRSRIAAVWHGVFSKSGIPRKPHALRYDMDQCDSR
jgi:cyclopropane-fatty-acyl-phospholipid synthase